MNTKRNGGEPVRLLNRRRMMHLSGAAIASSIINCSRSGDDSALETLQVSASPMLSVSSLHLAQESGYFSDVGLKLNIQQLPEPGYAPVLLAGGKIDVGFTAISPTVVNAIIEGARLKLVSAREIVSTSCGDFGAVYGTRETFPKGVDLRMLAGMRIAVRWIGDLGVFSLDTQLTSVGLSIGDVKLEQLNFSEAMAALLGGRVDCVVSPGLLDRYYPVAARLVRGPGMGEFLPGFQISYILFGRRLLDADPQLGANFIAAYYRGVRDFLQGSTPKFMEEYALSNDLDPKIVREACRETCTMDGAIDLGSIQLYADWLKKMKHSTGNLDPEQAVDTRFLDLAGKQLDV